MTPEIATAATPTSRAGRAAGIALVVAVIVRRAARPAPSVGGLRRGAPRLRSPCRFSFHPRAARLAPSVGGLRRGAPRLRSPCRFSFHPRAARPAPSVGGLRRGAPPLRSPCRRPPTDGRSEEHTSELQSPCNLVCRLLL